MLENNTFRSMMLVGGIMSLGMSLSALLYAPLVDADQGVKDSYHLVMGVEIDGESTVHEDHLTVFEALKFGIEGKTRGSIKHY